MKRVKILALAGAASMLAATGAMAAIQNSKHDLSSVSTSGGNTFSGTNEVCVFCHTPHGSDTSAPVPLWNRALNSSPSTTYTTYDSLQTSTLDGQIGYVGSVSLACLSCHDGTQAMDSIINEPGSGTDNAAYNAGTWTGSNQTSGKIKAGLITNIGVDLRNDHPVGVQYAGGGIAGNAECSTVPAPSTYNDADFVQPKCATINSTSFWYLDRNADSKRQRTDLILYTRNDLDRVVGGEPEPSVECASCHDPHETTYGTFLRMSNSGSGLCLACHVK